MLMNLTLLIPGLIGLALGAAVAVGRREPRSRLIGGSLAALGFMVIVYALFAAGDRTVNRYADADRRQGYALGFGLGEYLKQTHPESRLLILHADPEPRRDAATVKGLTDALNGSPPIVGHVHAPIPATPEDHQALYTEPWLSELAAPKIDIVISFIGLPTLLDQAGQVDPRATGALWATPQYQALQWVLPSPYADLPPGSFGQGRVLAAVWPKRHEARPGQFPAHLEAEGSPAELFEAWFELSTPENTQ
jgi:hypothetical protein